MCFYCNFNYGTDFFICVSNPYFLTDLFICPTLSALLRFRFLRVVIHAIHSLGPSCHQHPRTNNRTMKKRTHVARSTRRTLSVAPSPISSPFFFKYRSVLESGFREIDNVPISGTSFHAPFLSSICHTGSDRLGTDAEIVTRLDGSGLGGG